MQKNWQRSCTTRVYVQPPKAERLYTLWREGKLCFGQIQDPITDYRKQISSAIWFVDGDGEQLDFRKGSYRMHPDGIPVHGLVNQRDDLLIELETFADWGRKPACYIKLTLTNRRAAPIHGRFGFAVRTGAEKQLLFDSPDNYGIYAPKLEAWLDLPATWIQGEHGIRDGERRLRIWGDLDFTLEEVTGFAFSEFTLAPNESREAYFAYQIGDFIPGDYAAQREKCIALWEKELARITQLPEQVAGDPAKVRLVRNLVVHILQCFCYCEGCDYLLSRQGGLQRQIWTGEANRVLDALPRLGDFHDYMEETIDTYFRVFWTQTGEVVPFGIWWAMQTGTVLGSFSRYARLRGEAYFSRYREKAIRSFQWMRDTRASTVPSEKTVAGLFPPLSSCDDELVFQNWCLTDACNLSALQDFLEVCKAFGDPAVSEVEAELEDYRKVLRACWDRRAAEHGESDEIFPYYAPVGENAPFEKSFVFAASTWYLINRLDVPEEDCEQFIRYLERRRLKVGGMYHKMPGILGPKASMKHSYNAAGKSVVWYVSTAEFEFFSYFLRHGMKRRCEEILRDNIRFAMTDEYYMLERFHEDQPWFVPWSPNASANGRLITMLLDYYS